MEIPIQVAVRIRPSRPPTATSKIPGLYAAQDATPANIDTNVDAVGVPPAIPMYGHDVAAVRSIPGTATLSAAQQLQQQQLNNNNNNTTNEAPPAPPMSMPGFVQLDTSGGLQPPATFPFAYALPDGCGQDQLYMQCVYPMLGMYLEGFDASFVTYGQRGCGKTYTMLGTASEAAEAASPEAAAAIVAASVADAQIGIVQRSVRDIFALLALHRERNYVLNIGWVEVLDDEIHDLLDNSGNVPCSTMADVLRWLDIGMSNRARKVAHDVVGAELDDDAPSVHSIFTLTLEQHWVMDGLIQHRLSTASFCDMAGTRRRDVRQRDEAGEETAEVLAEGVPEDTGLQVGVKAMAISFV